MLSGVLSSTKLTFPLKKVLKIYWVVPKAALGEQTIILPLLGIEPEPRSWWASPHITALLYTVVRLGGPAHISLCYYLR